MNKIPPEQNYNLLLIKTLTGKAARAGSSPRPTGRRPRLLKLLPGRGWIALLLTLTLMPLLQACGDTAPTPAGSLSIATATRPATAPVTGPPVAPNTTPPASGPGSTQVPAVPASPTAATTAPVTAAVTTAQAISAAVPSSIAQPTLATAPAIITRADGQQITMTVELARTSQEQSIGLMGRRSLPADTGMLFDFKQPILAGFWMKNTVLPLSIAFIEQGGKIIDIKDMQPLSEQSVAPDRQYVYALEVPQGYFAQRGIKPGDLFTLK